VGSCVLLSRLAGCTDECDLLRAAEPDMFGGLSTESVLGWLAAGCARYPTPVRDGLLKGLASWQADRLTGHCLPKRSRFVANYRALKTRQPLSLSVTSRSLATGQEAT